MMVMMIKLTVDPEKEKSVYNFEKNEVTIGSKFSSYADLRLPVEFLEDVHVKLSRQPDGCFIYNMTNDPFTTVNDQPFGKLSIKNGDLIQIRNTVLFFELLKAENKQENAEESRVQKILSSLNIDKEEFNKKNEQEFLDFKKTFCKKTEPEKELDHDFDFELHQPPTPPIKSNSWFSKSKILLSIALLLIGAAFIVSSEIYTRIEEKSLQAEIEAARAVSDVALALTYVQINHLQLRQQNWADPHFLKNSMDAVISNYHQPYAFIDTNSRINNGDYMLRIYTNRDISRFLVIAQPEPSLMHWISPKNAIVIDSQSMMLHSMNDLKSLNRLLVNSNSLSGENGREILDLVKTEKIIPLKKLIDPERKNGFDIPKQLEFLRSGAENYVYNAPRYSQIGERLLEQAIDLSSRPGSNLEIKKLQEDINAISKLPNVILYTSKGMKVALKGQKALSELVPYNQFLIAYLHFDKDGEIKGSHLILDPADSLPPKSIAQTSFQKQSEVGAYQPHIIASKAPDYSLQNQNEIKDRLPLKKIEKEIEETISSKDNNESSHEFLSEGQFKELLNSVLTANSLEDLYKITSSSSALLRLENIPNSSILVRYQNKLRAQVLEKLKEMLFSSKSTSIPVESLQGSKVLLSKILLHSWVVNPEEQRYYLQALDRLKG